MASTTILVGNLGKDPEIRYTQGGMAICNFSLATETRVKQGDEWGTKPQWHQIVVFGKLAESCEKYLSKGYKAYVCGEIDYQQWDDKEGVTRYRTVINAREVQFLNAKNEAKPKDQEKEPQQEPEFGPNDDVPF